MNLKRILAGGVAAGSVISVGNTILNSFLIKSDSTGAYDAVSATPYGVSLLRSFALGPGCLLLYVLIRPRLGAGAKTAITAGLLAFLIGVLFPSFAYTMNGGFPSQLLLVSIVWMAVEIPTATLIGAMCTANTRNERNIASPLMQVSALIMLRSSPPVSP